MTRIHRTLLTVVVYIGAAGLGVTDISRACELSDDATS